MRSLAGPGGRGGVASFVTTGCRPAGRPGAIDFGDGTGTGRAAVGTAGFVAAGRWTGGAWRGRWTGGAGIGRWLCGSGAVREAVGAGAGFDDPFTPLPVVGA